MYHKGFKNSLNAFVKDVRDVSCLKGLWLSLLGGIHEIVMVCIAIRHQLWI